MTSQSALIIETRSLAAIAEIHKIAGQLPEAEYVEIRRAIGLVIGSIEVDILGPTEAAINRVGGVARARDVVGIEARVCALLSARCASTRSPTKTRGARRIGVSPARRSAARIAAT